MIIKNPVKLFALSIAAAILFLAIARVDDVVVSLSAPNLIPNQTFDSPLPPPTRTPPVLPTPTPKPPPSPYAQAALRYLAKTKAIPIENLLVAHEHPRGYPLSERDFMAFSVLDTVEHAFYDLLVDIHDYSVEDDFTSVIEAELLAYSAKYGKYDLPFTLR